MPGQLRREQGDRDRSGVERGEEAGDVVQALRRHDRDPLAAGGDALHVVADRLHPHPQSAPGDLVDHRAGPAREIEEPVGHRIGDTDDVALDQRDQRDVRRQRDASVGVEAVLDLKQAHSDVMIRTVAHDRSLGAQLVLVVG